MVSRKFQVDPQATENGNIENIFPSNGQNAGHTGHLKLGLRENPWNLYQI